MDLLGKAFSATQIREIYLMNKDILPQIYFTNISLLRHWSEIYSSLDGSIQIIVFKNSQREKKVKPMVWIQFSNKNKKIFEIRLGGTNLFSGKYILTKLINCEDCLEEYGDENPETNIDLNYISLKGQLLELSTEYM